MLQVDAQKLINQLVKTKAKHRDYDRVCTLAQKLKILITGEHTAILLRRFINRESPEDFIQRCAVTRAITPAVSASIKIPFYKVARNQRIKANIDVKDDAKNAAIVTMAKSFYGSAGRKTKGLDYWLKTRFMDLTFTDPNAWCVIEWDTPQSAADIIQARPFEVAASEALNFKVVNEEVFWLFTCMPIVFMQLDSDKKPISKPGNKYSLYEKDFTITYEQVDPLYLQSIKQVLLPNQTLITFDDTTTYLETVNTPKLGFVPAYRIGYNRDLETDGRTYVNPFHDGMCFFDKSLKTVSEFDLTMSQHAFPQKVQYAPACKGTRGNKCNAGYLIDGTVCPKCHGTGFGGHRSTMDVLNLPLPGPGTLNTEVIDLSKLIAYITPDIKLIQFQNDYTQQLKTEVHQAVFNSQVFVRKAGGGASAAKSGDGQSFQTATENDNNMQSVYDALEPFTEKYSDIWEDIITVFAILSNVLDVENVDIEHVFPADFKLKTTDILLGELKVITDSGAPSFMKDSVGSDLAEIIFAGDTLGLIKYRTKKKYFPFNGNSVDEVALLLSSPDVPRRAKVLYSNFESIFTDIEGETPNFYFIQSPAAQAKVVTDKVNEYIAEIKAEAPALDINAFRAQMLALPPVDPGDGSGGAGNNNNSQG
jgi:hypothetical protein